MKIKIPFLLGIIALFSLRAQGVDMHNPNAHCPEDTLKVNQIIRQLQAAASPSLGDRVVEAARALAGAGEDDYYTADSTATLRINVDTFTPLMFVNTAVALAKASQRQGYSDWRNMATALESIALRRGEDQGYPSIMYHTSDWIIDNTNRGNLREITEDYRGGVVDRTKSLDEMTRYRKNFAALADSADFEKVRMTEMGFRTHRIPTLKKETIKKREILDDLQNGDIVILVPSRDGVDWWDIGIVEIKDGEPYLIHLSPAQHQVVEEKESLLKYMPLMTKYFQGYRIVRLKE